MRMSLCSQSLWYYSLGRRRLAAVPYNVRSFRVVQQLSSELSRVRVARRVLFLVSGCFSKSVKLTELLESLCFGDCFRGTA